MLSGVGIGLRMVLRGGLVSLRMGLVPDAPGLGFAFLEDLAGFGLRVAQYFLFKLLSFAHNSGSNGIELSLRAESR